MRHHFGRRSEQLDADQLQLGLEDVEIALGHARAAREALAPRARSDQPRKTNRGSLPTHLERIEQIVDIEDKSCPCCSIQRAECSRIIVEDLRLYLDARLRQISAKSKLAEAIRYATTRCDGLVRFIDDGRSNSTPTPSSDQSAPWL
jgi:hypothetical protein